MNKIKYLTIAVSLLLSSLVLIPSSESTSFEDDFYPCDSTLEIQLPENFMPEEHFNKDLENFGPSKILLNPQDAVDYLIITSSALWDTVNNNFTQWKINKDYKINSISIVNVSDIVADNDTWVNGKYGDGINASNGNPWVENGTEMSNELFNDTQCKIRNFIRKYVFEFNTTYVLLFGNRDMVPARMMCSYSHSGPTGSWYNNTNHAVDMYYACLNGNFNNNTNSRWGENNFSEEIDWATVSEWDWIDYDYDVLVGRVLVNTITEANYWINKEKAYVESNDLNYLMNGIMAGKDVLNQIDDYLWTIARDEFPDDMSFLNNYTITAGQWNVLDDYCNGDYEYDGFSILFHCGHGGTLWTPYQPVNLHNSNFPNFLYTEGCNEGDFGSSTTSRTEQYMQDDGSMFAGISNSAYGWFTASEWYAEEFWAQMFNESRGIMERNFCKAHFDARENVGWQLHSVAPMIFKETNFFGDPALEFNYWNEPIEFLDEEPENNSMNILINLTWNITVISPDADFFELNISCNNSQWSYWPNAIDGTYGLNLTLDYDTWYNITVWAYDIANEKTETYRFRTRPETYPVWDVIEDGICNYLDVSQFVSDYLSTGAPGFIRSDIIQDGIVNYLDASVVVHNYGKEY